MKRNTVFVVTFLLVVLGAAPLLAGGVLGVVGVSSQGPCSSTEAVASGLGDPFGYFDGNTLTGGNGATGSITLFGWALDDNGVAAVDILVDGGDVGRASYGLRRADVSALFPGFPDSALPGFEFELDTSQWLNGLHTVAAIVVSNLGEVRQLNDLVLEFNNNTHNLRPFGRVTFPEPNSELFAVCDLGQPRRYSVIEGWALDLGVEVNDHGVGYVELLIDGAIVANTRLDCAHSLITGEHSNCYGVRRLDVETRYPFALDSPNAGFRFVLDVGQLINFGWSEGHHTLTVRVGDVDSQVSNIDSINVNFKCQDLAGNEGSLGAIDEIVARRSSGTIDITGWALDGEGVALVKLFVDGRFNGIASYGFIRPDVTPQYPGFPNSNAPGWLLRIDTGALAAGQHEIVVIVVDSLGDETQIGKASFLNGP